MRQFHARHHFGRVEIIDRIRAAMREEMRQRGYGWSPYCGFHLADALAAAPEPFRNRYARLCGAVATYRVAGFLFPQEL